MHCLAEPFNLWVITRNLHLGTQTVTGYNSFHEVLSVEETMLTYRQALERILQRTDFERDKHAPYGERVWRLSRVSELLGQLGNPHLAYPTVHIAGTKGKGSTTAMIESILRAAGYRTGMYTSPHLHTFRERIRLDSLPVPKEDLVAGVEHLSPILDSRPEVTVFEIITALAMWIFAQKQIDWGVFEVGLGGRLDATNVLQPQVTAITSISLDHTNVLGDTLGAIAGEKGGIIKEHVPVIIAPQHPEALAVLQDMACAQRAPLIQTSIDWQWRFESSTLEGQHLSVFRQGHEEKPEYPSLRIPLLGAHQLENACIAVAAVSQLQQQGVDISTKAVRLGLERVRWPGRMEILGRKPLVIVDGAHNGDSISKLLAAIDAHLNFERLLIIFGAGTTHEPSQLLEKLLDQIDKLWVTRSNHPKATSPQALVEMAADLGYTVNREETVAEALDQALDEATSHDLVLITGSLFLVADARSAWMRREGMAAPPNDPPGVY